MIDHHTEADEAMPGGASPDYTRHETRAHQLDRNWAELLQELRVIGTGVQILFAFLLGIAFQARFNETTSFQRGVYLATLLLSALATALLIAPVAIHRFLFQIRVKDRLVAVTNALTVLGLAVLSISMTGAVLLTGDWVAGSLVGGLFAGVTAIVFLSGWFAFPLWLRRRADPESDPVPRPPDGR
jgi:Family of unknown function (DUF6328)